MRWNGVMHGATRDDLAVVAESSPVQFHLHESCPHLDCLLAEPVRQITIRAVYLLGGATVTI
jgi:hypothetical protein